MARGKPLDDDTRSKLIVGLQAGRKPGDLAAEFNVPSRTVYALRKLYVTHDGILQPPVEVEKFAQVGKLQTVGDSAAPPLMQVFVSQGIEGMIEMFKLAADPNYLRKYPPSQIALLMNATGNVLARVVEATAGAPGSEAEANPPRGSVQHEDTAAGRS